jgi:hypothetical protein
MMDGYGWIAFASGNFNVMPAKNAYIAMTKNLVKIKFF